MSLSGAILDSAYLLARLNRLPTPHRYFVGFSGGADSTALLQCMFESRDRLRAPLHALHFHHGLRPEADAWLEHCRDFCSDRGIPCETDRLVIPGNDGCSPEEAFRNSRYRAVARILGAEEMFLTAHHAEDQAETLFLNLMRGSGVEGLAGIPPLRSLDQGWVARPLLELNRNDLTAYLIERDIDWLTDPSNADTAFDRNYLRHELFPLLERRWPGLTGRLARSARNARVMASVMAEFIERQSGSLMSDRLKLNLPPLLQLDPEMQTLVLRQWLRRHEVPVLPEQRLRSFLKQLSGAAADRRPEVQWDDWMLKRYRDTLWLHRRPPFARCPERVWREVAEQGLGPDCGRLRLVGPDTATPGGWYVRPRRPGDRIRLQSDGPSRTLKHFFQEASIPPWLRDGVPVLEWDGEPVALGDWVLGQRLRAWLREHGLQYRWEPGDPVLARLQQDSQP